MTDSTAARKLISAAAVLVGLLWMAMVIFPIAISLMSGGYPENFIKIAMGLLMSVPGLIFLEAGIPLWREMRFDSLGRAVGAFCSLGVLFLVIVFLGVFSSLDEFGMTFAILFSSLAMVPVYLIVMRFLFRVFTGERRKLSDFVGRGMLGIFAVLVWLGLAELGGRFERSPDASRVWGLVPLLLPIFLAWAFYRIGCWRFCGSGKSVEN